MTARQYSSMPISRRGIEGGGRFGERFVEETERGGLAAPLQRHLMGAGRGGRRRAEEFAQRGEAGRPVLGSEGEGAPLFERGERIQLVEQTFGAGARLPFLAQQQRSQLAEAGVGNLLAHGEIETVRRGEIGEARGEAQDGERARVVPAAQHRLDGAGQEAHHGVVFQGVIEIEARRNSEAFQRGAQRGRVDLGGPHDDAHLAERTSRVSLHQNAAGDLFDFALDDSAP